MHAPNEQPQMINAVLAKVYFAYFPNSLVKMMSMKTEVRVPICEKCGYPIDDCKCVCPYCGETSDCQCCIGTDKVTGG